MGRHNRARHKVVAELMPLNRSRGGTYDEPELITEMHWNSWEIVLENATYCEGAKGKLAEPPIFGCLRMES